MTVIKRVILPNDERGNDPNDFRDDSTYINKLVDTSTSTEVGGSVSDELKPFDLSMFALNGKSKLMKTKMLEDKYVLGRLAVQGQSTTIYAPPNMGKTLLVINLLIQSIKNKTLKGEDVYYINADDHYKGLVTKLELAEKYGFMMLAPGHEKFEAKMLPMILSNLIQMGNAAEKILILDTVKKFTDLMRKDVCSKFGDAVRQFVSHGGSVIMLAHVNKHRDGSGKLIYAGTSDLVDDVDCTYTLDMLSEDKSTGTRTVAFQNFKSRGDISLEEVYEYNAGESIPYHERLESVRPIEGQERKAASERRRLTEQHKRNREAIEAIKESIGAGITRKTELVRDAQDRSGLSKRAITKALKEHTGPNVEKYQFWILNIEDKNAHVYQLNRGKKGWG